MADFSTSSRKPKTTKKTDRSSRLADRSSHNNLSIIEQNEEKSTTTDPYQCTGRFSDDFNNLCRQNQITCIPSVLSRPRRAPTPTPTETTSRDKIKTQTLASTTRRTTQASNLDSMSMTQSELTMLPPIASSQKQHSIGTLNEQSEETSHKEIEIESLPKTFILVKDRIEYFKPKIHVEYEHPEKSDNVIELFVRGWKIEVPMMNVFQQCLPRSEKLVTLNLWHCGLNDETLDILVNFLPKCPNLRNLSLDGNPIQEENFHKLLSNDSLLQSLSLRNCQITDSGAQKIGHSLGNIYAQNKKLIILNLSLNSIGDKGAIELANGLRTNRTLLVLNLSSNEIGDLGAKKFAETCSRFKMSHEEIVRRRSIRKDQILRDNPSILRKSKPDNTNDRPQSMLQTKTPKESSLGKSSNRKENANRDRSKSKDQNNRESTLNEKQSGSKLKAKEKDSNPSVLATSTLKKEKPGRDASKLDNSTTGEKGGKTLKSKGSKSKLKDSDTENENIKSASGGKISGLNQIGSSDMDPLMDEAATIEGDLWLTGNRTLISLNLSRNKLTEESVKEFLLCIQYQISINLFHKSAFTNGLLKLNLTKNDFAANDESFLKLSELMKSRDPIANKTSEIPVERGDTVSIISKDGKETSRSKSGRSMLKSTA